LAIDQPVRLHVKLYTKKRCKQIHCKVNAVPSFSATFNNSYQNLQIYQYISD
jgi:hypothetical protein